MYVGLWEGGANHSFGHEMAWSGVTNATGMVGRSYVGYRKKIERLEAEMMLANLGDLRGYHQAHRRCPKWKRRRGGGQLQRTRMVGRCFAANLEKSGQQLAEMMVENLRDFCGFHHFRWRSPELQR